MSLTESPSERLLIQGACKRMAASNVCLSHVGQDDKLRPAMMRIDLECDQSFPVQVVDNPLHVLAIGTQVAREPRDRLRALGGDDGAEDLPPGARQPEPRHQPVPRGRK